LGVFQEPVKGKDTYAWADGAVYPGDWENDRNNGKGVYTFEGMKYIGDFVDDKFNGKGILVLPDARRYGGSFKNEWMNGQ